MSHGEPKIKLRLPDAADPEQGRGKPDAELDLICVRKGRFVIGEAMSSARDFTERKLARLVEAAQALRPDVVVLACMEPQADRLEKTAEKVRQAFIDVGCELEILTPDAQFDEATEFLPVI